MTSKLKLNDCIGFVMLELVENDTSIVFLANLVQMPFYVFQNGHRRPL